MIKAILFDLDGTLVQSEKLKALSYAKAVQQLRGLPEPEPQAIDAYREIVGASREEASRFVMGQLGLEGELRPLMSEYEVDEPWDVLTEMRKAIYDQMVADPQVIRDNKWPHTVELLSVAREYFCQTGLATMSMRKEALHVLNSLDLENALDVILTREDVTKPKPDPEIYLLAAQKLGVPPTECLVIEDSSNGVQAAMAAGTNTVALATPFTSPGLHKNNPVDHAWMVHDPTELMEVVQRRVQEHNTRAHKSEGASGKG